MKKLHSLQVIRKFAFDEWGGPETVVWNTSRNLVQNDHETEILATNAFSKIPEETVDDVLIKRFPYFYPYLNLSDKNSKLLDRKGGDPYSKKLYRYLMSDMDVDLIHCHGMQRIANTVRLAARKKNIPFIVSSYDECFQIPEFEKREMMKLLKGTINYGKMVDGFLKNKDLMDDADGIICAGHNEFISTRKKYPGKLVEFIPNGVDIDKFKIAGKSRFRTKYKIPKEADLILCVSNIDYQKNQIKLIELVHLLNKKQEKTHVLLIGSITSNIYYQMIQKRIKELNVENCVTIIPGLNATDPELVQAYNTADFFILPSTHEPFSIVVLEAWASRLPVIANNASGLQNLINHKHTGLFYQNDSLEDLAAQYHLLKNHPGLLIKLIHNAYDEICEKYTWQIITEKLMVFYRKVRNSFNN